jgi:hypothetical protein
MGRLSRQAKEERLKAQERYRQFAELLLPGDLTLAEIGEAIGADPQKLQTALNATRSGLTAAMVQLLKANPVLKAKHYRNLAEGRGPYAQATHARMLKADPALLERHLARLRQAEDDLG